MAATMLIPLHHVKSKSIDECLDRSIDYVRDARKTEDEKYLSTYGCDPETVKEQFLLSRKIYEDNTSILGKNEIIAYQIRQSFKPGEITPEKANELGYELAMKFTKGKHAFIVTTHTDKHHIHNHVIFNAVDIEGKRKFRNMYFSSFVLSRISDMLCLENNLSVIQSRYEEQVKSHGRKNAKSGSYRLDYNSLNFLVDIEKKMREGKGKGYENWARKFNLKQRAKVLLFLEEHGISSYEELVKKTDSMDAEIEEFNNRIKDRNKKMADNKELQNAIIAYSKGTDDPEKRKWAKGVFNKIPDGKIPKMTDLRREYGELIEANKPDFQQYVQLRKERKDYLIARKNLELLLHREEEVKQEKAKATPSKSSRSETSL
nr:relaxase/mobilization nuclease domain-containing protein [uncultured Butyrivibrio sp.]